MRATSYMPPSVYDWLIFSLISSTTLSALSSFACASLSPLNASWQVVQLEPAPAPAPKPVSTPRAPPASKNDGRETTGDEASREVKRKVLDALVPLLRDAVLRWDGVGLGVVAAHGRREGARRGCECLCLVEFWT